MPTEQDAFSSVETERYSAFFKHRQPAINLETENIEWTNLWVKVGRSGKRRSDGLTFFARIRDGKFLIEEDWTEDGIASELIEAGVPKEDIVLAFHESEMRAYTEFAAA